SAQSDKMCFYDPVSVLIVRFFRLSMVKSLRKETCLNIQMVQYNVIRPHRSSNGPPAHHRVPTGCNGGRLTSCPCSMESGCGSVDSTSPAASRCFSSSN